MRTRLSLSFAIACALASPPALLIADQCFAQSETRLELAQQPLSAALRALGNQTKTNILFDPVAVKDLDAPAVMDATDIEDALTKILAGQGQPAGGSRLPAGRRRARREARPSSRAGRY